MKKLTLLIGSLLLAGPVLAQDCDRDCLRGMLTTYLDAMLKHDPALVPTTDNVRFTEDHKDLRLGEGLWDSIQGYGTFRQDVLDVRGSTAGTHVLAMENGNPVLVAIRLKIEGGKVSEAETTVVRNREEGMIFNPANVIAASPAMNVVPTPAQRNSREELVRLAMLYPAGLRIGSFVEAGGQFADETYRFENGQLMAGPGCTFFANCERVREQSIPTLPGVTAQVAAVDEELGIVWLRMNFGPGSLMRGEGELSVWEMFKIYDGRIQAIEAFMEEVPPGTPFGWTY
jgi:hypothetical protein